MRDAEFEQRLLRVARGLEKADLVLKGGNVFNSFTGEWETADGKRPILPYAAA